MLLQETLLLQPPHSYPTHSTVPTTQIGQQTEGVKIPIRKEKSSPLKSYAIKLGLNERGFLLCVGLSALSALLIIVLVVLAALWPGYSLSSITTIFV